MVLTKKHAKTHKKKKSSATDMSNTVDMSKTIPKIIHQVYGMFDDGIPLQDIPVFYENVQKTKSFCETHHIQYKMWDISRADTLIHKLDKNKHNKIPFKKIWKSRRFKEQPILKADFIRYCILFDEGGIYVDCDIHPIRHLSKLFQMPYFFVTWKNDKKKLPYNAVLGTYPNNPLYIQILLESCNSFYEKVNKTIYDTWKGRFVFQTTGHFMLQRVLKHYKTKHILNDVLIIYSKNKKTIGDPNKALFKDANASLWYK